MTFTRVPIVLGEKLTVDDCMEYVRLLLSRNHYHDPTAKNAAANATQIKPPAIKRIYNSKACRGALMFGTKIDRERAEDILRKLGQTQIPFQCAHGRVSVVPLMQGVGNNFRT